MNAWRFGTHWHQIADTADAYLLGSHPALCTMAERHLPRRREFLLKPRRVAGLNRVDAVEALLAALAGHLARLGEADGVDRAEPHLALAPIDRVAEEPGLRPTTVPDLQALPGPEFWPFFGRLAQVVGVEPSEAIKAAQACRTSGERHKANGKGLFAGDRVDTPTLHVDCRVGDNFLSLGVFKPTF